MSSRSRLFIALGAIAALMVVVLGLREGEGPPPSGHTAQRGDHRDPPRAERPPGPAQEPRRSTAPAAPDPAGGPAGPAKRDGTGELLSSGPAQTIELPERSDAARDNVPSKAESEAMVARVVRRLETEIAQAQAAGDTAKAERLEVRRARLERKRDDRAEADAETAEPEPEPGPS